MTTGPDAEMQGWYYENSAGEPTRVRLSILDRSMSLHTLSDRLVATWSLDHLETREVPVLGQSWRIGDRRLPEPNLVLVNDQDYETLRKLGAGLRPLRARVLRQFAFAAGESGNLTGWPVFVVLVIALLGLALWSSLSL
jgi:hypothetical protein